MDQPLGSQHGGTIVSPKLFPPCCEPKGWSAKWTNLWAHNVGEQLYRQNCFPHVVSPKVGPLGPRPTDLWAHNVGGTFSAIKNVPPWDLRCEDALVLVVALPQSAMLRPRVPDLRCLVPDFVCREFHAVVSPILKLRGFRSAKSHCHRTGNLKV